MKFRYRWLNLNSKIFFGALTLWLVLQTIMRVRTEGSSRLEWEAGATFVFVLILRSLLLRGYFRARFVIYFVQISFISLEMSRAVMNHEWTGFLLNVLLVMTAYGFYRFLEESLCKSSVNPEFKWYEGRPSVLPRLSAVDDQGEVYGIRSMDEEGLFIIRNKRDRVPRPNKINLKITFKDQEVSCAGEVVSVCEREVQGFGLQFCPANLYDQTNYTGLVQRIKGEGII